MRTQHRRAGDDAQSLHATGAQRLATGEDQIRAIYQFMYRHVGNRSDAESLTERACSEALHAARELADAHDEQTLDELLWRTAHTVVTDHLRWFYGAPAAFTDEPASNEPTDALTQVRDILAQLPATERDVLARRFLANASLEETAAALHVTLGDALALQWLALTHAARIAHGEKSCATC